MCLAKRSNPKIIIPSIHQCWDGGMRGAIEFAAPQRRVGCLTKSCMQTPAPTPAKTRRVMHANATLPPPAGTAHCADLRVISFFFSLFFALQIFLQKTRSKIAKIANLGFLAPRKGRKKKIKSRKSSKMGSPGPRFWVFFEPRFANLKTFKFAAMRSVS